MMRTARHHETGLFCVSTRTVIDHLFLEVKGDLDACSKILINDCVK